MHKILLTILIFALVIVLVSACNGGNGEEIESQENSATSEEITQNHYLVIDDLVWNVEPTIEADSIWLCCQHFFLEGENVHVGGDNYLAVNHITGEIYETLHGGHGIEPLEPVVFDPETQLFGHRSLCAGAGKGFFGYGLHPISHFAEEWHGSAYFVGLQAVERVNASLRRQLEIPEWDREFAEQRGIEYFWELTEEAHSGEFALMRDLELVTDFIFDEIRRTPWSVPDELEEHGWRELRQELHATRIGDNCAVLCVNRGQITDFIFKNLFIICDDTAFAQVNGKWGIVNITESLRANS